jgi:hypothetical protein
MKRPARLAVITISDAADDGTLPIVPVDWANWTTLTLRRYRGG